MTWEDYFELFSITDDDTHQANSNIPIDKDVQGFVEQGNIFFVCGGKNLYDKES